MKNSAHEIYKSEFLLAGFIAGILYFLLNLLLFFPSEQLQLMDNAFLKINLFVYSFCIWVLAFMLVAGILHLITYPLGLRPQSKILPVIRRFIVYSIITLFFSAGHTILNYYNQLHFAQRVDIEVIKNLLYQVNFLSMIFSLGLSLVWSWAVIKMPPLNIPKLKQLMLAACICSVYIISANLFDLAKIGEDAGPQSQSDKPRIVLLGVDAGSWNVLLPFINNGDLPAFKKLLQTGSYGYLDTYGRKFTPVSFANIATGKKPEKHTISKFINTSSDWKAAPIWSIMSSAGKRVSVVHWPAAEPYFKVNGMFVSALSSPKPYFKVNGMFVSSHSSAEPYFKVNGMFVSGLSSYYEKTVYFSDDLKSYKDTAMKILGRWGYQRLVTDSGKVLQAEQYISHFNKFNEEIISRIMPDLIVFNYYPTDPVQHFFWLDMAPKQFSEGEWEGEQPDESFKDTIKNTWIMVDGFISKLLETYGEDTYYFIVSDHGAKSVVNREVTFDMNTLLEQLGYLEKNDDKDDRENSTCYVAGKSSGFIDLKINPSKYTTDGKIDLDQYKEIRSRIASNLNNIVLKDLHKSIFTEIKIPDGPGTEKEPDISVLPDVAKMPRKESIVSLDGKEIPARTLFKYHPWSGRHRGRGIIMAKGPLIKHKYIGAWTIDDPYTIIFRHSRGIIKFLDIFTPALQVLRLVDGITTLDITPTLLHLAKLPVAEDMDGRVVSELINDSSTIKTVPTYHLGNELKVKDNSAEEQRRNKLEERLKALGYMQ